jgi:hypothetical protein
MTSLNLRLDIKLGFVTRMLEKKVHRITVLIVASTLLSSLERWTSEVVVVVGDVTIRGQQSTQKSILVIVAKCS